MWGTPANISSQILQKEPKLITSQSFRTNSKIKYRYKIMACVSQVFHKLVNRVPKHFSSSLQVSIFFGLRRQCFVLKLFRRAFWNFDSIFSKYEESYLSMSFSNIFESTCNLSIGLQLFLSLLGLFLKSDVLFTNHEIMCTGLGKYKFSRYSAFSNETYTFRKLTVL